jgi:starch phosphorylase
VDTKITEQLDEIAQNLWWCWQPEVWRIFEELDRELWRETHHNPAEFLERMGEGELGDRARDRALASRIHNAHRRLDKYLEQSGPRANMAAAPLHASPVAYFCAEFCLHESIPIYSGGLGVLAGDHLKSASDRAIPIVGVGLFYHQGYFRQSISDEGWQLEEEGDVDAGDIPIEKVTEPDGSPLTITVPKNGDGSIAAHVWQADIGRNRLYLLDADIPANPPEDRELSERLYGGDSRMRIRQEVLLGVGGVRALDALDIRPGVYHLNEGHCALAPLELCAHRMEREGIDFQEARRRVADQTVFTTHTPVPAGHDRFEIQLFEDVVGWMREELELDHRTFHGLGRIDLDDPLEPFCMTVLALKMSEYRNGVSHLHGRVSRSMWSDLWPERSASEIPIGHVTNGIHVSSFLASEMRALYDRHLGSGWSDAMDEPETWEPIESVPPEEMWETHQILKSHLLDFVHRRVERQTAPSGDGPDDIRPGSGMEPDILTIGFARRFARYKRADLILSDIERFEAMVNDADRPIQIVYAGKAHPKDDGAKELIQRIVDLTTDPAFAGRVVFLVDYGLDVARHMIQGVDVWLNNPRRPQEACGTSGQKAVFNGVLNCSILDGWWAEGYDGANGFAIGDGEEFVDPTEQDAHDARALYEVLDEEVVPAYYETDEDGLHRKWVDRMKWAIQSLGWRFNADRMLLDYLHEAYLPALGATNTETL